MEKIERGLNMILHSAFAVPLLLMGWLGWNLRKTALGGTVSFLITWQGLLAFAALTVFRQEAPTEGALLLWFFAFSAGVILLVLLVLALRQYYGQKNMKWEENEEVRH